MEKLKVVKVDREKVEIIDWPEEFDLSWAAKQIGADWCEIVRPRRLPDGCVMIVDEEGKLKPDAYGNVVASWFYATDEHGEPIVGDCLFMNEKWGPDGAELAGMDEDLAMGLKRNIDMNVRGWQQILIEKQRGEII